MPDSLDASSIALYTQRGMEKLSETKDILPCMTYDKKNLSNETIYLRLEHVYWFSKCVHLLICYWTSKL